MSLYASAGGVPTTADIKNVFDSQCPSDAVQYGCRLELGAGALFIVVARE